MVKTVKNILTTVYNGDIITSQKKKEATIWR